MTTTTESDVPRQAREALAHLLLLAEMQPADVQAAPAPQAEPWRKVVGAVARGLDQCAANAPDDTHRATMREAASKLMRLLITPAQAAPAPQPSAPSGEPAGCPECGAPTTTRSDRTENCTGCSWWTPVEDSATTAPAPLPADVLLQAIQRLNQTPYNLTKSECINVLKVLRSEVGAAHLLSNGLTRCPNCDDTGDVNSITGEWRGICHCPAGQALRAAPQAAPVPAPSDDLLRLFTSYGNAMYRNDPDAAERIAEKFSAALASPAAAEPEPMTERDQFDLARWHKRLGELADAYYEAGRTNPARQRARAELMMHALDCATGWRARSAAAHAAADQTPAVPAEPDRAWLVEWRWNGVQWLYLIGRRFSFTADPNAALRFARRADAEAALAWVGAHDGTGAPRRLGEMLATEHEWVAATPQEAPARYGLTEAACQWGQEDEGSGTYWSACGHGFTFNDGGPTDNGLKHCCYCGKPLIELPWVEPEPDAGIATPAATKEQQP